MKRLIRTALRPLRSEEGAVTAEFVIIFPIVVALIGFLVLISLMISTTSDVQQVAHELARKSFRHLNGSNPPEDVCQKLRQDDLAGIVSETLLVRAEKLTLRPCPSQPDAQGRVTITVDYNFGGDFVQGLGRSFGVELGTITRSSVTFL
ncbi:TadE/TadG family type IV pilus assembly protein [Falsigemmobacter faecalis]|uniref:Pilus assembly protein n=1 Tax=Falsigemmobacter faecalis TaxID=2488730 RepID=A0A3P3DRL6_9RHOB|nr:TadE family protein [Falsigemmobacter faecalis]RRH76900.1 pilus assembly protein [Falsigemmobacter faecalis]